jgi:GNAT superfamily N-acetyltransferase
VPRSYEETCGPAELDHSESLAFSMPISSTLIWRLAHPDDVLALTTLIDAAITELQRPFLDEGQIAASRSIMGIDQQLIEDGTYYIVETNGEIAGCGGWSRRATLYGNDNSLGRDSALLDPAADPARIRAMYTHPAHVRKGVGRLVLQLCENAAREAGFRSVQLMSTMAGEPLYRECGYTARESFDENIGGIDVPLLRMTKTL